MTAIRSSEELIERLTELSEAQSFDSYRINARNQARRWLDGERLEWIKALGIPAGDTFHQQFSDLLAAEGTRVLMQHSNPRQASAKWWRHHIEPIHWLLQMLAVSMPCDRPRLPVKQIQVTDFR